MIGQRLNKTITLRTGADLTGQVLFLNANYVDEAGPTIIIDKPNEKVGLGVLLPTEKLDIDGNLNLSSSSVIKINGTEILSETTLGSSVKNSSLENIGTLTGLTLGGNLEMDGNSIVSTDKALPIVIGTGSGDDFSINTSGFVYEGDTGNVGIGDATPSSKLEVAGTITAGDKTTGVTGEVIIRSRETSDTYRVSVGTTYSVGGAYLGRAVKPNGLAHGFLGGMNATTGGGALEIENDGSFHFCSVQNQAMTIGSAITTNEYLTITNVGRIGIGETSPDYKLDINGSFGFTPGTSVTPIDNGDVVIEATNNTTLTFKLKGSDGTIRTQTLTLS